MNTLIQSFQVSFPSSGLNSIKNPAKISSFFPGKVSFPSSSSTSNGLKYTKTKHPALQVVCVSNNLREEQRIRSELKTLRTKVDKEMRKGNVDVAVKLIQEKMARYLVTLTEAEGKKMARLSRGTFVTEAYKRHLEAKTKDKPTTTPTAVVGRSTKKNRKQKIPPKEDKKETPVMEKTPVIPPPKKDKKEDAVDGKDGKGGASGGGWWTRRRWNGGVGGHARAWKTQGWRKPETNGVKVVSVVNIHLPPTMEAAVSLENPKAGDTKVKSGMNIHITMQEKAAASEKAAATSVEKAAAASEENAAVSVEDPTAREEAAAVSVKAEEDTKVKSVMNIHITMPEAEKNVVSVKKAGSGGEGVRVGKAVSGEGDGEPGGRDGE